MADLHADAGEPRLAPLVAALGIGEELFWVPDRLPAGDRWAGDIPFLWWLVTALRPSQVVVLGAAADTATAAVRQAIERGRLPTRVFIVDPDATGDGRHAHFVTVLQSAGPEAFAVGSVDLLHLAGRRPSEALARALAVWTDRMSPRGVVLCDATTLRDGPDGWRFWQGASAAAPSFELIDGDGLGLLGVGPDPSPPLRALFATREDGAATELIRRVFAMRGEALSLRGQRDALRQERAHLLEALATAGAQVAKLEETDRLLRQTRATVHEREALLQQRDSEAARRDETLRDRDAALALQSLASRQRLEERDAEITRLRHSVTQYRDSTSWRITRPLRAGMRRLQALRERRRAQATAPPDAVAAATLVPAPAVAGDAKTVLRANLAARLRIFLAGSRTLALPTRLRPDISILLVLHNQADLTFGCLSALAECLGGSDLRAEIIVFDNASTDATRALLARVSGASVIAQEENLHFLLGVNRAARVATGRHLLLLNNDVQVLPGSLEAALATLDGAADIGAVGARIVLPDGTLQEAGSIIWSDGSCSGYARGRDPTCPEAMARREVDYCSGAFLLTPRAVFERLGGLDERYVPAYYEETDYCLRLWQSGLRVVYEPDAVVLHHEFGSASGSAAALAAQLRNREIFRDRHRDWLAAQWPNRPEHALAARRAPSSRKRVLMIEDRVPHVRLGAGYPRARDLLHLLAAHADVTLFPAWRQPETLEGVRATLPAEIEVMLDRALPDLAAFLRERAGFYDAIIVCRPTNMRPFVELGGMTPALRGDATVIYDAEAIFANREMLKRGLAGVPLSAGEQARLLHAELALARQADAVISVSAAERAQFAAAGVEHVHLLGHAIALAPTRADFASRTEILFVGAMHDVDTPNTDSLRWFAEAVLPLLRERLGAAVRVTVVGVNSVAAIAELDGLAFDLVGAVEDLRPYFERARIFIAPTRFAAGMPHKIAQAAAYGVPVVATDLLARQLGWQPGRDLLAATGAAEFAEACARLYVDAALWEQVRAAALERCREDCAPQAFADAVLRILDTVPARRPALARPVPEPPRSYVEWVRAYDTPTAADRAGMRARSAAMTAPPLISVLVPAYDTLEPWLRRCIASVRDQLYPHWELCLVDDASPLPHVAAICREAAAADSRIRFVRRDTNGHIAAATNTAFAMARGDFVALLDHDDELADHALYVVAEALAERPGLDLIFSDEDKIDARDVRHEPWFKSGWNPDLMLAQNAVVHLAVYRRAAIEAVGGWRSGFDGSQDYDLTLRVAARTPPERILHLPFILYHWRAISGSLAGSVDAKAYAYEAAARAIQDHLDRTGAGATVTRQAHPGSYRVHWPLPAPVPRVTIIIPTRDRADLLRNAVDSIFERTSYADFDVLIIDNRSGLPETRDYLAEAARRPRVRVLAYDAPYSFAALNNWAVRQTDAPLVALLNNDVAVITPDWLAELAAQALRPDVGAAGAMLYYPDDTIQHAGIVLGIGGLAGHPHHRFPRGAHGYFGRAAVAQRLSAVSAACMVLRRAVFLAVGGFDEANFAVAFNDVDLCLRLQAAGHGVVWTPHAALYHHESSSLGPPDQPERRAQWERECRNLRRIWGGVLAEDPYYSPNLTLADGDFAPAFPPRVRMPWRRD